MNCQHPMSTGFGFRECWKPAKWSARMYAPEFPSTIRIHLCGIHARTKRYQHPGKDLRQTVSGE